MENKIYGTQICATIDIHNQTVGEGIQNWKQDTRNWHNRLINTITSHVTTNRGTENLYFVLNTCLVI